MGNCTDSGKMCLGTCPTEVHPAHSKRDRHLKYPISQRERALLLPLNFNQKRPLAASYEIEVVSLSPSNNAAETESQ